MSTKKHAAPSVCPRCGYDFEGVLSAGWNTNSNAYKCSECGFEFTWEDLLEGRLLPKWFVESGKGVLGGLLRVPTTSLRMAIPWLFWRHVRVEACATSIRARPWIGWVLGLLLLGWLSYGAALGGVAGYRSMAKAERVGKSYKLIWYESDRYSKFDGLQLRASGRPAIVDAGLVFLYALVDPIGVFDVVGGVPWSWVTKQNRPVRKAKVELRQFWFDEQGSDDDSITWSSGGVGLVYLGAFILLMPTTLLLLPSTRRQWKGGFAQIFRLFALSLLALLVTWVICCVIWACQLLLLVPQSANGIYELAILAGFILLIAWWSIACWRFLKLGWWPLLVLAMVVFSIAGVPMFNAMYHRCLQAVLDWFFM